MIVHLHCARFPDSLLSISKYGWERLPSRIPGDLLPVSVISTERNGPVTWLSIWQLQMFLMGAKPRLLLLKSVRCQGRGGLLSSRHLDRDFFPSYHNHCFNFHVVAIRENLCLGCKVLYTVINKICTSCRFVQSCTCGHVGIFLVGPRLPLSRLEHMADLTPRERLQ